MLINTKKFKDWKKEQLEDYIANLRLGKIRIKNSLYAIMISCPFEMLVATTKENNKIDSCIMDGWECYCPRFDENEDLMGIRNPQINSGNICKLTNKSHDEYKWFGYYVDGKPQFDFVVFVNTWNADLENRAQGCDFDIDSIYLTNNDILKSKAEDSQAWATPVNGIKGTKEERVNDAESLADLDNYLGGSTMNIGKIVNKSAIFNAYMYNAINKKYSQKYINACYEASSTLSSFSQVAIDMAKKSFEGLSLTTEMNNLNKTYYINAEGKPEQILQFEKFDVIDKKTGETKEEYRMIVPYFFKYIAKDNSYRVPTQFECGMDYLEEIIDEIDTKAIQTNKVDIKDLLIMQKDLNGGEYAGSKIDDVRRLIDNCQSVLNKNRYDNKDDEDETKKKSNIRKWIKKDTIKQLQALKLNQKTVHRILLRAFGLDKNYKGNRLDKIDKDGNLITYYDWDLDDEFILNVRELKEMTMLVLTLIYNSYAESFIKCFKEKKSEIKTKRFWI